MREPAQVQKAGWRPWLGLPEPFTSAELIEAVSQFNRLGGCSPRAVVVPSEPLEARHGEGWPCASQAGLSPCQAHPSIGRFVRSGDEHVFVARALLEEHTSFEEFQGRPSKSEPGTVRDKLGELTAEPRSLRVRPSGSTVQPRLTTVWSSSLSSLSTAGRHSSRRLTASTGARSQAPSPHTPPRNSCHPTQRSPTPARRVTA